MNSIARCALVAVTLLPAACASPAADSASRGSPQPRDLHLDVTLASGARVPGAGEDQTLSLFSDAGRTAVPLSQVRAIDRNADGETVTLRMADGTTRRGVLESESIVVFPAGAVSPQTYPTSSLRAVRVTPRIRIEGSGDAWWDVAFVDALGTDVAARDGRLTFERIDPAVVNAAGGGTWSAVTLSRDVAPLDDFDVSSGIAWDAGNAGPRAMQSLSVRLLDARGRAVASAGHHDAWTAVTGCRWSVLGGKEQTSGYGTQPAAGRADLRIVREKGRLRVLWDGCEIGCGESAAPVARVVVQADYYAYRGPDGDSTFGTETIERLEVR